MKITTAGLPRSESELTVVPETVSGRLKLGIDVPSSRMVEGVRDMSKPVPRGPQVGNTPIHHFLAIEPQLGQAGSVAD
jgi:hypothetical protein